MIVEEQNIDVEGLPVHYLTAGEGPTLVLLHALGESALDWRRVLPALARTHRIYRASVTAPSLPPSTRRPSSLASSVPTSTPWGLSTPRWSATRSAASLPCAWRCPNLLGLRPWAWWPAPAWAGRLPTPCGCRPSPDTARVRSSGERRPWAPSKGPGYECRSSLLVPDASPPSG